MLLIVMTVVAFLIGVLLCVLFFDKNDCREFIAYIGAFIIVASLVVFLIELLALAITHVSIDGQYYSKEQKRASLVYQLEHDLYDNDNDVGKKELYLEIQEWNSNLAYGKKAMDDPWIGAFYPNNLYENFDFIELE